MIQLSRTLVHECQVLVRNVGSDAGQMLTAVWLVSGSWPRASEACARRSSAARFIANDSSTDRPIATAISTNNHVPTVSSFIRIGTLRC
jgi:hypothetical protein